MLQKSLAVVGCLLVFPVFGGEPAKLNFNRDVRPILSETCFRCHGPDEGERKSNLRLDVRDEALKPAKSGAIAIVPGKPDESELIKRIVTADEDDLMPPTKLQKPLSAAQKETLRRWIGEGAEYHGHWAFQPPRAPEAPKIADVSNPIDAFIAARLETEKLALAPEASREVLIRRVSLALSGLPPTPAEVDAFLADQSPGAYEAAVDRLLKSPHFGERMAVPWLDLARHSDTGGYHNDSLRQTWIWRDWVVRAFNENKPFNQFTIEQLAGDLLPDATVDQKVASGFMRNVMTSDEGGIIPEEYLNIYVVDRVSTLGTTWMGMSIACAQCHDHKYDPVTSRDFYSLYAFFNQVPERGIDGTRTLNPEPRMPVPSAEEAAKLKELEAQSAQADKLLKERESRLEADQSVWEAKLLTAGAMPAINGPFDYFPLEADANGMTHEQKPIAAGISGATAFENASEVKALDFKGTGRIELGARYDFEKEDKFGVGVWVKLRKDEPRGTIISKMDNTPERRGWDLEFDGTKASVHLVHKWPEEAIHVQMQQDLPRDSFQHVAFTYDGSGKAAGVKIYVNGISVPTQSHKDKLADSIKSTAPAVIGSRSSGDAPFNGSLHALYVAPRMLEAADIVSLASKQSFKIASIEKSKRTPAQQEELKKFFLETVATEYQAARKAAEAAHNAKGEASNKVTTVMVMNDMDKPRDTFIKVRGAYDKNGDKVTAAFPVFLAQPSAPAKEKLNRLDLAQWLTSAQHPLTSRVAINRFWATMFGTGIVKTLNDFGSQGEWPSHPELLDWLATDFSRDWDVKRALKQMVMSRTFRQSAAIPSDLLARDSENRWLARGPRIRLEAEFIRDAALAIGGLLNPKLGGPSVFPYQPPNIWEVNDMGGGSWQQQHDEGQYRRALYVYHRRSTPYPSLLTFDAPSREVCTATRARTSTPLQSLVLMNDPVYVEAARAFAVRMLKEGGADDAARLAYGWKVALARSPSDTERAVLMKTLAAQREHFTADKAAAEALLKVGDFKAPDGINVNELATWTAVANIILNLNETISR